jgi:hypothetical protein
LNTGELVFGIEPTTKHRCIPPLKRGVLAFGALINNLAQNNKKLLCFQANINTKPYK